MRRNGARRSWDELEADLLDQRLISRVAVKEVEDGFALQADHVGGVVAVGGFQVFQSFVFVASAGEYPSDPPVGDIVLAGLGFDVVGIPLREGYCAALLPGFARASCAGIIVC